MNRRRAWRRAGAAVLATVALVPVRAPAAADPRRVGERAVSWLLEQRLPSGRFGGEGQPVDQAAEALAAIAATGRAADASATLELIERDGPARAQEQAAFAARIVLGLIAADRSPVAFGGHDYVADIDARYNPLLGAYGGNLYAEALSGLALHAAGRELPRAYLDRLRRARCDNGGYAYSDRCGRPPDADTTAMIVTVLRLAGDATDAASIPSSLAWLRALQAADGAFPLEAGFEPNANSTGLVVLMLRTLGEDLADWDHPESALARFAADDGALAFTRGGSANLWATVQGAPALFGARFPMRAPAETVALPVIDAPRTQRTEPGSPAEPRRSASASPSPRPTKTEPSSEPARDPVAAPASGTSPRSAGGDARWASLLLGAAISFLSLRVAKRMLRRGSRP